MKYITFLLGNKVPWVTCKSCEALLKDLRVARRILFPIENEKNVLLFKTLSLLQLFHETRCFKLDQLSRDPYLLRIVILFVQFFIADEQQVQKALQWPK